jgi:hypothetical protein
VLHCAVDAESAVRAVLAQEPAGRSVGRQDKFKVNPKFQDRMRRLRVSHALCFFFFEEFNGFC